MDRKELAEKLIVLVKHWCHTDKTRKEILTAWDEMEAENERLQGRRCENCKWWRVLYNGVPKFGKCNNFNVNDWLESDGSCVFYPQDDFYCKYWEAKE